MSRYRRLRIRGGTWFFTVTLADRRSDLLVRRVDLLRDAWAATWREAPFHVEAAVILPDHLHAVWRLPVGDDDFSDRWRRIKGRFSRGLAADERRSLSKRAKGEKGVWQRRLREHAIRDEEERARYVRYCWLNPVKHGLAAAPVAWPYSSIHRDIRRGVVEAEWRGAAEDGDCGSQFEPPVANQASAE